MAMTLFEVAAKLSLDTSEFENEIKKVPGEGKKSVDELTSWTITKSQLMANAISSAFKTGMSVIKNLVSTGMDFNKQMETYTANFKVMLGSEEDAAKKVNELKSFAAKTPFELGDLADAIQTLLAFNVDADKSTDVLKRLGDISLGNSEKLGSLTRAYGKMSSSQKVSLENIQIMIEAGYNPLLNIQEKTGESMERLYDRISKGGVSFSELEDAIEAATSEGGQFFGGMDEGSKTTAGLISTLKDNVAQLAGSFSSPIFSKIGGVLQGLIDKITEFSESVDWDEYNKKVDNFINFFVENGPEIISIISGIGAGLLAWNVVSMLTGLVKSIKAFQTANEGATVAQALLNTTIMANPIGVAIAGITTIVRLLGTLWATNEDFRNSVIETWNSIKENLSNNVATLIEFFTVVIPGGISALFGKIVEFKDNAVAKFQEFVDGAKEKIQNFPEDVKRKIEEIKTGIKEKFNEIVENAKTWGSVMISGFINGIKEKAGELWDGITGVADDIKKLLHFSRPDEGPLRDYESWMPHFMEGLASGIEGSKHLVTDALSGLAGQMTLPVPQVDFSGIADKFIEAAGAAMSSFAEAGRGLLNGFKTGIDEGLPILLESVNGIINSLSLSVSESLGTFNETGAVMLGNFHSGLISRLPEILAFISDMVIKMAETLEEMSPELIEKGVALMSELNKTFESESASIGEGIVRGVWNGISSQESWFRNKVYNFFNSIVSGVKSSLGISSISTYTPIATVRRNIQSSAEYSSSDHTGGTVTIVQNIYSERKTAADLEEEALYQAKKRLLNV